MTDTEKCKFSGYYDVIRQLINNAEVAFVKDLSRNPCGYGGQLYVGNMPGGKHLHISNSSISLNSYQVVFFFSKSIQKI